MRSRLKEVGIGTRRPLVRPILKPHQRLARLNWAQNHIWTQYQWRNVLFTDESRYKLHQSDGRIRVYGKLRQRYEDDRVF